MLGWYKGNSLQIQGKICQIKIRKVQLMARMATSSLCQPEHIPVPILERVRAHLEKTKCLPNWKSGGVSVSTSATRTAGTCRTGCPATCWHAEVDVAQNAWGYSASHGSSRECALGNVPQSCTGRTRKQALGWNWKVAWK